MVSVGGDPDLPGEVVGGAEGDDAEGDVEAIEAVDDFVDGSVATYGHHDVHATSRSLLGLFGGVTHRAGQFNFDEMTFFPNPSDQVQEVGSCGASAVHDEDDMSAIAMSNGHELG
jgi:hypothetical protein